MPKRIRFIATILVSVVLTAAGLFQPRASSSQQSPQATTTSARNAALIAATGDVLKETSEIRQLAILRPVQSSTQSRTEIERMLIKNLDEETTPAQMHAAEVTLKRLGLAPPDFQYRALMLRVLTEQVAGYYDPKTGEFHLADWIDLDGQRPVMAHELTHALQDQHFNLRRFDHWPKGDSDAELAAHALIEGDATLAMALYVANSPLRALAFLKSLGATGMASPELDKAPRALRETLLFTYQEGMNWTRNLYKQGGWERVSKAFTELPQSTEQIMHPEKYYAHEAPVKVTLPDITGLLNAESRGTRVRSVAAAPDERAIWKRLDNDVEGEWGFYLILDEFLKSPAESRRAAAGWGGDRFAVYESPKGEVLFVSVSSWDTENDAREFFEAYVKRTELRYPGATELNLAGPPKRNQEVETGNGKSFRTSAGGVTIELRGNRVAVIEGLPDGTDPGGLLRALW
jgi:heme-degrading monooxygenase HmoA